MTLLEKLRTARIAFQNANIKKTGYNPYSEFAYYELSDILPKINELSQELGFICTVTFTADLATMQITDTGPFDNNSKGYNDSPPFLLFTSPMSSAKLKAAHEIQNLGAVETYERRYLYITAFEIVENDNLDKTMGKESGQPIVSKPAQQPLKQQDLAQSLPQATANQTTKEAIPLAVEKVRKDLLNQIKQALNTLYNDGQPIFSDEDVKDTKSKILEIPKTQDGNKVLHEMLLLLFRIKAEREEKFGTVVN